MLIQKRLRELRREKGETQLQVAEAIGIAVRNYQRFEAGANLPSLDNAYKLADHFEVTLDYLVCRTDQR